MFDESKRVTRRGRVFAWICTNCRNGHEETVHVLLDCNVRCDSCGSTFKAKVANYLPVSRVTKLQ